MAPDPEVTLKEYVEFRFDGLEKRLDEMEKKIEPIIAIVKVWRYIGVLAVTIVVAIAINWLTNVFGL